MPEAPPEHVDRTELLRDVRRVADRLRSAPPRRLDSAVGNHATAVVAAQAALRLMSDVAVGTDARDETVPPTWRPVPDAGPSALGDQVAVLGSELARAITGVADEAGIWTPAGRSALGDPLTGLAADLRSLRMAL